MAAESIDDVCLCGHIRGAHNTSMAKKCFGDETLSAHGYATFQDNCHCSEFKATANYGTSGWPPYGSQSPLMPEPSPVSDATSFMGYYTGVHEASIGGFQIPVLMAGFAERFSKKLKEQMDALVAERVAAELRKESKRNSIPTFKRNARKFRT